MRYLLDTNACIALLNASLAPLRAELDKVGEPIGPCDMTIRATARAHSLTVVTANPRELQKVVALRVENWLD